jgi:tetratricopeptide (TPR) repeat protein
LFASSLFGESVIGKSRSLFVLEIVMRKSAILLIGLLLTAFTIILAVLFSSPAKVNSEAPISATPVTLADTPADKRIRIAETAIKRNPKQVNGYNQLCVAFMQKARETGDFGWNVHAEDALKRSLATNANTAAENYDALRLQATLHLTYHRFAEALQTGQQMQKLRPDDHYVYGVLTDALVELGRYAEAVKAADKMVDLRPDATSYARISYLRALHGYPEHAIEAMRLAVRASSPRDSENHAWYRVQLGNELLSAGNTKEAAREFDVALQVFPDYYEALAAKAQFAVRSGAFDSAIDYYRRAQARVPLPETAVALGDLYTKLGRLEEAKQQYALLDALERSGGGTHSQKMALYLANHDLKLDEALAIAQRERAARADIYTCDVLAWCLFKKGDLAQAKTVIEEALRLKTRDARIYYHAGMIYHGLNDRAQAAKYLKMALDLNSSFDVLQADVARQTLKTLAD